MPALAATLGVAAPAWADDPVAAPVEAAPPGEIIVVHGDPARGGLNDLVDDEAAARDRRRALAEGAFVTRIHVDERAGEAATLSEVIASSVGTHVRSLGGLGSFSSISVRGAATGHTTVLVDGVPLSRVASVTADLGRFELSSFDEVELYRGGVPVALGGAALGGALELQTRIGRAADGTRLTVSAGAGSFGARHLRARWGDGDPDLGTAATVGLGYAGADGDFAFFDDGGTNLEPSDDGFSIRGNNGYHHVDGTARLAGPSGEGRWAAGVRGLARRQGLPGAAFDPAAEAHLETSSVLGDAVWTRPAVLGVVGLGTRAQAWSLVERQRFADPDGEIGLGNEDRRYLTTAVGATSAWTLAVGRHLLSAAIDGRGDWFRDDDMLGGAARVSGTRQALGLAVADDVAVLGGRWVIEPAVRLDVLRTDPLADRNVPGMPEAPVRTDVAPSPRVSTRALITPDLALKASAGWYFRAPTLVELYGDRGFIVGSPDLRAERGLAIDAGVLFAPARRLGILDRLSIEAAAFASGPRDTIALVSTGTLIARPLNVGHARIVGAELSATGRLARTVTLAGNYTLLATEQDVPQPSYDGKALPQRPRHELYGRIDVAREVRGLLGVIWADVSWVAGNFLDQAELNQVPARQFVGAGIKLELPGGVLIGVEGKNLLDARVEQIALDPPPRPDLTSVPRAVADIGGYPLPGRAVYVAVEWRR